MDNCCFKSWTLSVWHYIALIYENCVCWFLRILCENQPYGNMFLLFYPYRLHKWGKIMVTASNWGHIHETASYFLPWRQVPHFFFSAAHALQSQECELSWFSSRGSSLKLLITYLFLLNLLLTHTYYVWVSCREHAPFPFWKSEMENLMLNQSKTT
jgi:hypothetical protein